MTHVVVVGTKIFLMGDRIGNQESWCDLFSGHPDNIGIQNFIHISWRLSIEDLYLFFLAQEVAKVVTSDQTKGVCEKTKLEILLILCKQEILASYEKETGYIYLEQNILI